MGDKWQYLIFLSRLVEMMEGNVADKTRSGSEGGLKPAISFGHFRVFSSSNLCHFIWIGWKAKFWHFHKKRVGVFWKRVLPSMFRVFPQLLYSPLWANWLFHHTMHAQCWNTFVNNTLCSLFVLLLLHSILSTLWANCISHQSTKLFNFLSLLGEL